MTESGNNSATSQAQPVGKLHAEGGDKRALQSEITSPSCVGLRQGWLRGIHGGGQDSPWLCFESDWSSLPRTPLFLPGSRRKRAGPSRPSGSSATSAVYFQFSLCHVGCRVECQTRKHLVLALSRSKKPPGQSLGVPDSSPARGTKVSDGQPRRGAESPWLAHFPSCLSRSPGKEDWLTDGYGPSGPPFCSVALKGAAAMPVLFLDLRNKGAWCVGASP